MASPFKTFRKNQKAWMVAITILAMISFVFLGNVGSSPRPGGAQGNPEVFTWKFGTFTAADLQSRVHLQHKVQFFLARTAFAIGQTEQVVNQFVSQRVPTNDQEIIFYTLLNRKAEDLGIVISDDMIRNFILEWTDRKLSGQQINEVIRGLSTEGGSISQTQLFDALRFNLSAWYAERTFMPSLMRMNQFNMASFHGDTPADRWDYFERLNRKATIEAMSVPVKNFVDKVPDPTAAELQKFYDEYKNAYGLIGSRTPGFRQPYKAQFEYVKADNETLLSEALPTVTEEEVKEYYEKHKATLFKKSKLPELPSPDETKPDETKPEDAAKTDSTSDAKAEAPKADDAAKGATKADPKAGDAKGTKGADGKSSATPRSSLNGELLAVADDEIYLAQKSAPSDAKSDGKAPAAKADAKAPAGAKADAKADAKAVTDAKASEAKAADAKAADATTAAPADSKAGEAPNTGDSAALPGREVEYEPLEKVAGQIKNQIAQNKVDEKVMKALGAIETQMSRYHNAMEAQRAAEMAGKASGKQIQRPDLEALAKEYGLQYKQTGMVTWQETSENLDIGKSRRPIAPSMRTMPPSFIQVAFTTDANGVPAVKTFAYEQSEDNSNNKYLWWKIADESAHTPPLDAIKADVVQAWKEVKARKLAADKANEYAAEARKTKQTLKEAFGATAGMELITPGPFTWLTRPAEQPFAAPRMAEVTGLDKIGYEFMQNVFKLKPGETGVAPNDPLSVYYVVQVESDEPPLETLRENFLTAMNDPMSTMAYATIAAAEHEGDTLRWFTELKDQYGFKMAPDYKPSNAGR